MGPGTQPWLQNDFCRPIFWAHETCLVAIFWSFFGSHQKRPSTRPDLHPHYPNFFLSDLRASCDPAGQRLEGTCPPWLRHFFLFTWKHWLLAMKLLPCMIVDNTNIRNRPMSESEMRTVRETRQKWWLQFAAQQRCACFINILIRSDHDNDVGYTSIV